MKIETEQRIWRQVDKKRREEEERERGEESRGAGTAGTGAAAGREAPPAS